MHKLKITLQMKAKAEEFFYFFNQKGSLKDLLELIRHKPTVGVPLKDIRWILNDLPYYINKDKKYSLMKPVPIVHWNGQLVVLSNFEQVYYADKVGAFTMLAKLISSEELKQFFIHLPKTASDMFDILPLPESYLIPVDLSEPVDKLEEVETPELIQKLVPSNEGGPSDKV